MVTGLWQRWRQRQEARVLERRAIPDSLWQQTLVSLPFLGRLSADDTAELRRLASLFLDDKEFSGAGGLEITDAMALNIAAQACLPVLRLGLAPYGGFVGIVVHPDEVVARRSVTDDDGIVHDYDEVLAGEAMVGGPVMLSWRDVATAGESAEMAYNVVIHEFAHILDMGDGVADGVPPLPTAQARDAWLAVLDRSWRQFCRAVDGGRDTLLDPYGATAIEEFFAVAVEAFFVSGPAMRREHPPLYRLLARYFRQDPAAD